MRRVSKTWATAAAILMLCAAPVHAAGVKLPADLPPFGKDKSLPAPKITKKTLPNGFEIWVVPRDGLPRVDYVLAVRGAGFAADTAAQPGLAAMLAGVLNEGTASRDSRAVAEAAQGMGGSISATPSNDGVTVSAKALASKAAPMLQLLAEVVRTPAFPDQEVALAKANALQGLSANEANPGFRADRALGVLVFGGHPYGRTRATARSIEATTPELLRSEHTRRFRPDRSLLVIAGPIDAAEAVGVAEAAFADWKASGPALPDPAPAPRGGLPSFLLLERPGSVQSTVRIGSPGVAASTADQVALRLTSTILGEGFSSRVNLNLREEKGYTYGARAGARSYRIGGAIIGGADVRNEVTGAALHEFFAEYTRIGTELVSPAELAMSKRYVAGSYLVATQLQGALAGQLASNWLIGLPSAYLGEFVPKVQKVTAQQVRAMGQKYFAPVDQSIVVVGDKAVAEQLKPYGNFTVQAP